MPRDNFRAWLAGCLRGTKYATVELRDEEIDRTAKRLGVDVDLLLEVRAKALIELHARGLSPPLSNTIPREQREAKLRGQKLDEKKRRLYQFHFPMPPEIVTAWKAECEVRGVHPPTFLRSLIHEYLLGTREPNAVRYWGWRGKIYRAPHAVRAIEPVVIPQGARRALFHRASSIGATASAVVRGLVLEALEGEHRNIPLMSAGMMYDDETRYNTVPLDPNRRPR